MHRAIISICPADGSLRFIRPTTVKRPTHNFKLIAKRVSRRKVCAPLKREGRPHFKAMFCKMSALLSQETPDARVLYEKYSSLPSFAVKTVFHIPIGADHTIRTA
ncbi:MAG: hypothetical protein LUE08_04940 [Akkermansiaceae bacterium]|nr:hypothetical protein [Akkermansiaceae bacterium]